jgi:hypothetical protein
MLEVRALPRQPIYKQVRGYISSSDIVIRDLQSQQNPNKLTKTSARDAKCIPTTVVEVLGYGRWRT